ncbi:SDR family NAD(P)-dependent oxidoreductase [Trichocoleus sp. FACHB-262]|uniref:SDR family NAD(P)-dependent oxidoreductase n=1 Tax=Trichocoleus sp. FACHB-262 TaxID=2692869 RepID=UPI001683A015|nr:3-oxoacyl-ACP reductase FabG [Trichocoleus sp. FACHB-262]MBD2119686.1 3-oxoacyl-ACP reductase FabG [Trichocoleus sp. FACHB-262]
MSKRLAGKVAVVTGGSKGLGQAFAKRLAEDGADVAIAATSLATETEEIVKATGQRAIAQICDVTDPDSVAEFAAVVQAQLGKCDILVNNAGIYPFHAFDEMSFEDWRKVLAVSLDGTFLMCKAFIPGMKERQFGRIINLTSTANWLVIPNLAHYNTAKMGVIGLTRALATEMGEFGITVNAVAPGLVRTGTTEAGPQVHMFDAIAQMQAIKRTAVPDEIVGAVSFLACQDAALITGQTLAIDGGLVRL